DIVCLSFANLPPGHPEDKCIVVLDRTTGETYFRLDVLESVPDPNDPTGTCTKLICKVGVVPDTLTPGDCLDLCVACGTGKIGAFQPIVGGAAADGVSPDFNPQTWSDPGKPAVVYIDDIIEVGPIKTPPPLEEWIHAVFDQGRLCLTIPGGNPWPKNKNLIIDGHLRLPGNFGGQDIQAKRIRLNTGGTSMAECVGAIKDVFRCVWDELDNFHFIQFTCEPVDPVNPDGDWKITMQWPDWDPADPTNPNTQLEGFITLCCIDPPKAPIITGVTDEISGTADKIVSGEKVIIDGDCFSLDPNDSCVVFICPDGTRVPIRIVQAIDRDGADGDAEQLIGCVGPIPDHCDAPGCLEIMTGRGQVGNVVPNQGGVQANGVWNWDGNDPCAYAKWPNVTPCPVSPPPDQTWFFADLVNGKLCVTPTGNWPANAEVTITARAHNDCQRLDLDGPTVRLIGSGTALECAGKIKDVLRCAFLQQTGAQVNITCVQIPGTNSVKLTICLENGKPIDWGLCTICVRDIPPTNDKDGDGLTDAEEAALGTDECNPDSDGDGLLDGEEVNVTGTDPLNPDSDGDGCDDGSEVAAGTDPLDATDCTKVVIKSIDLAAGVAQLCIPRTSSGVDYTVRESQRRPTISDFQPIRDFQGLIPLSPGGPMNLTVPLSRDIGGGQFRVDSFFDIFLDY
ncbi:MAG: hypothetical protein HKN82_09775, partial [Akkermansiaceae bacterium]|nr:hypothetical protein [Akkermansiaceae bacterium]